MNVPLTISPLDVVGLLLVIWATSVTVYGLFFSPLRHLPGPWHTRFSSLHSQIAKFSGKGAKSVDRLHQTYGPIVRVAPTLVAVTGEQAVRTIYGGIRPYSKDASLADLFSMCRPEHPNVAGIRDASEAMKRRRVVATAFSNKFLDDSESIFAATAQTVLLTAIENAKRDGTAVVDILHIYRQCATQVIVDIAFGGHFDTMSAGDPVALLDDALHGQFMYSLSRNLYRLMRLLPSVFPYSYGCDRLAQVARRSIENYQEHLGSNPTRKDCLGPLLEARSQGTLKSLSLESIVSETMVFLFAGVDSTANTATYATWEIARNPHVQQTLRAELQTAFPNGVVDVASKELSQLRYLNGCIAETLRLHAPFPGLPTRTCPKDGQTFHGYMVPGGVSIGVQQWTIGRDPLHFPSPETFDPMRWDMDIISYHKELDIMMAFSFGPRICIGKNLALHEIRHFLAALFMTYSIVNPATETTDQSMDEFEAGLTVPRSGKCVLEFH